MLVVIELPTLGERIALCILPGGQAKRIHPCGDTIRREPAESIPVAIGLKAKQMSQLGLEATEDYRIFEHLLLQHRIRADLGTVVVGVVVVKCRVGEHEIRVVGPTKGQIQIPWHDRPLVILLTVVDEVVLLVGITVLKQAIERDPVHQLFRLEVRIDELVEFRRLGLFDPGNEFIQPGVIRVLRGDFQITVTNLHRLCRKIAADLERVLVRLEQLTLATAGTCTGELLGPHPLGEHEQARVLVVDIQANIMRLRGWQTQSARKIPGQPFPHDAGIGGHRIQGYLALTVPVALSVAVQIDGQGFLDELTCRFTLDGDPARQTDPIHQHRHREA